MDTPVAQVVPMEQQQPLVMAHVVPMDGGPAMAVGAAAVAPVLASDFIACTAGSGGGNHAGTHFFGVNGPYGAGYYRIGSAACDAAIAELLTRKLQNNQKALNNVICWSPVLGCCLQQQRVKLEGYVHEISELLADAHKRNEWATRMSQNNPSPARRVTRGGGHLGYF